MQDHDLVEDVGQAELGHKKSLKEIVLHINVGHETTSCKSLPYELQGMACFQLFQARLETF
jgi:hypothetical protein